MKTVTIFHGQLSIDVPDGTVYLTFDPLPEIIVYLRQIYSKKERVDILDRTSPYYSISIDPYMVGDTVYNSGEKLYRSSEYPYRGHHKITDEILQFLKAHESNSYQYW